MGLKSQKKKSQKKMLVFCLTPSFESLLQKALLFALYVCRLAFSPKVSLYSIVSNVLKLRVGSDESDVLFCKRIYVRNDTLYYRDTIIVFVC